MREETCQPSTKKTFFGKPTSINDKNLNFLLSQSNSSQKNMGVELDGYNQINEHKDIETPSVSFEDYEHDSNILEEINHQNNKFNESIMVVDKPTFHPNHMNFQLSSTELV